MGGVRKSIHKRYVWFRKLSWKQKVALIAAPILAFLIIVPIATYIYFANDIKDQERLMNRNNTGIVLQDREGEAFYSIGRAEERRLVPLEDISDHVEEALIATEDKDFYEHSGFNLFSIGRAAITGYGGGSTISQQLAKNTLLSDERSLLRKYQELFISIAIEQNYTKDEILTMYLNSVYYGENAFGIEDAAETYFGKKPADLSLAESAMLIGVLPAPSAYSPISGNPEYAKDRQTTVLARMSSNGYISEVEKDAALDATLVYAEQDDANSIAPHFVEMVIEQLSEEYGYEQVMRSGYRVQTTLDRNVQEQLDTNVKGHVAFIEANGGSNASAVAIDPRTGEIRALVGSADYGNEDWGKVNMVTTARQPGSSFKPIYYAAALAEGKITPATVYRDEPINLSGWQPRNADGRFRGDTTVRSALSQSLNIPSIKVMEDYGVEGSVKAARQLGIDTIEPDKNYGLSLSLGAAEATLLDMTNAYAAFANQGRQRTPTYVTKIDNKLGQEIFRANGDSRQAISQGGAFLISDILSDSAARAPIFGASLNVSGHTAAVKTGTTDENRDAWTIGYTPSLAIGVWVGNNDNSVMANGGSGMAGPIWRETMSAALSGKADERFTPPSGVVQRATCFSNHGISTNSVTVGTYPEYYLASALPTKTCTPEEPKPIEVCRLRDSQVVEIDEKDFDGDNYSRDIEDCEEEEEAITIEVCELASGDIITIDGSEFDPALHSRDTENCDVPDEEDDNPGQPGNPDPRTPVEPSDPSRRGER